MGRTTPDEAGQRVIGEFFFVHAPEARVTPQGGQPRRTYEFLHATFGEYLVASRVMIELGEVAARAFAGRRVADPQDDLLFALLSYQPLASRKTTLTFAGQIAAELPAADRVPLLDILEMLLGTYRDRHGSDQYAAYRPVSPDTIRQLACYCANLVSLRVVLAPDHASVPLSRLLTVPDGDALAQWQFMVRLWQSGLDASGMRAMLSTLLLVPGPPARVFEDTDSILIPLIAGVKLRYFMIGDPPGGLSSSDVRQVALLIFSYLAVAGKDESVVGMVRMLFRLPRVFEWDEDALGRVVGLTPTLLEEVPELGELWPLVRSRPAESLEPVRRRWSMSRWSRRTDG
jgi:hypothetical protein